MCVSRRETRREYVHVASSSTSMSPTVSRRDTRILAPPQARCPASGTCCLGAGRSIDPPAWVSVVERLCPRRDCRSEEHTSELQSLLRNSYAVHCLNKKTTLPYHHNQK